MTDWFEDESFWIDLYPFLFPDRTLEAAEGQVEAALVLAGVQGGNVLDLCCGPGRHSIALARRGFAVTGVDRTRVYLEKARERAQAAGVSVEWVLSDMRDFVRPGAFDLVLSMFTSFGYFDDPADDVRVLENIHHSLRPGGACVMDVIGKERLAAMFQPAVVEREPDGTLFVQLHEARRDWTRMHNEWILIRGDRARRYEFEHTIYSGQELRGLFLRAGFSGVRLHGDLKGSPYDRGAKRLVAVAAKA